MEVKRQPFPFSKCPDWYLEDLIHGPYDTDKPSIDKFIQGARNEHRKRKGFVSVT